MGVEEENTLVKVMMVNCFVSMSIYSVKLHLTVLLYGNGE